MINYHFVWSPRCRRKLLTWRFAERQGQLIYQKAKQLGCRVLQFRMMSDHIHLFLENNPHLSQTESWEESRDTRQGF
jgi:putative transposase